MLLRPAVASDWALPPRLLALALVACPLGALACSAGEPVELVRPPAADAGAGDAGTAADAIRFSEAFLALLPASSRAVEVTVTPPGVYPLRFSLSEGSSDASLDRAEALTSPDGTATFVVAAPSQPAVFSVTASTGEVSTALPVSVSSAGFATLEVVPIYQGGRDVPYWAASVHAGATCATLTSVPPPDGPLFGQSVTGPPRIEGAPIGPSLAVTVRSAWAVSGCKDASGLVADEVARIEITTTDVPLALAETNLELEFGVASSRPWEEGALGIGPAIEAALLGGASDDVEAVLDAMQVALPSATARAAFAAKRAAGHWDAELRAALGVAAGAALRTAAADWVSAGAARLTGPGVLGAGLAADGSTFGLSLGSLLGLPPGEVGLPAQVDEGVSWTAEPDDTVVLGVTVPWNPARLYGAAAVAPAREAVPGAEDVPSALSGVLDCAAVGAALEALAAGDLAPGCATGCAEPLCAEAMAALWARALEATPAESATLTIGATATTRVDERARPSGFEGTWVGALAVGSLLVDVGGALVARRPPD